MTVIIYTCTQCRIDIEPISLIIVYDIVREWTCNLQYGFLYYCKKLQKGILSLGSDARLPIISKTPNKF